MIGQTAVLTLRASLVLTSSYVASTAVTLPQGVRVLNMRAVYTRSAGVAAGSPSIIVETSDDGTTYYPAAIINSTITASGPVGQTTGYQWSITLNPPGTDAATPYGYRVAVLAGSLVRVRCAEVGGGAAGILAVTAVGDVE